MEITKLEAIKSLTPNAEFVMVEDEITEWHSEEITQPTDEAVGSDKFDTLLSFRRTPSIDTPVPVTLSSILSTFIIPIKLILLLYSNI